MCRINFLLELETLKYNFLCFIWDFTVQTSETGYIFGWWYHPEEGTAFIAPCTKSTTYFNMFFSTVSGLKLAETVLLLGPSGSSLHPRSQNYRVETD